MDHNRLSEVEFLSDEEIDQDIHNFLERYGQRQDVYVFAYASLMWSPCFSPDEKFIGRIQGFSRSLSLSSIIYRGTVDNPGIVMALEKGGNCEGVLYKLSNETLMDDLRKLWEREMKSSAYYPRVVNVYYPKQVIALTFVADEEHRQFCGNLDERRKAEIIKSASGEMGSNLEYFEKTWAEMRRLGIQDADLLSFKVKYFSQKN